MTSDPENLRLRIITLEGRVAELSAELVRTGTDAQAARILASGADHDVSEVRAELRAHLSALNALREGQLDLANRLTGMESELRGEMQGIETKMHGGFAKAADTQREILGILTRLEAREG
jgi:chromosome segregation ATPase